MDASLIESMISQFPSLMGLMIAIIILWQIIREQSKREERLIDALIKRENCEED